MASGTLIVVVSRARDLPNKRKMEKQNPYCLLRISNLTDKTNACIRGGQTPKWDEEFRFNITSEIQPILKISLLDETKKSPVFISETEIDFTPAFYSSIKEGYDNWYQLKSNDREAGEIYLEMTFYPNNNNDSFNLSGGSSHSKKTIILTDSKRELPPLPGQEIKPEKKEEVSFGIPPPIERKRYNINELPDFPLSKSLNESNRKSLISSGEFKNFTKKLSSSFSKVNSKIIPSTTSSNPFDELEREVQSDWTNNNKKQPPPLPSHSSPINSFSSSRPTSPARKKPLPTSPRLMDISIDSFEEPTTYDKFVKNAELNKFKSSLPPLPPK